MSSNRSERQVLLNARDSARRATRRPWRLTLIGIAAGVLTIGLVLILDTTASSTRPSDDADIIELTGPKPLDQSDTNTVASMLDPRMGVDLPRGGWIQVAGVDGQLAQQYRCKHLDPSPAELDAHWIAMESPEVELYMSRNRLVTLVGDTALAYAPQRALEEGQFNGNVRIAMYEPILKNGQLEPADPRVDTPSMVILTPRATFDNFLGKIACDGRIELETPREKMVGRDLQVLLNDEDQRIEYLQLRQLDYLRIHSPRQLATAPHRHRVHRVNWQDPEPQPAPEDARPDFYQLTLHDGVRIVQGTGATARTATGDAMHLTFSLKSEDLQPSNPIAAPVAANSMPMPIVYLPTFLAIGASQGATVDSDDDILVTCGGMVTMVPLDDREDQLTDPRNARLDLIGRPVLIEDPHRRLRITCPLVQYHTMEKRFDLLGDDEIGVNLLTDRLRASGSWMWARPEAGQAGFNDPGVIEVMSYSPLVSVVQKEGRGIPSGTAADEIEIPTDTDPVELKLTWSGGVDIEFEPDDAGSSDPGGDPALQSILFRDEVAVDSEDGTIQCGSLEMRFARSPNGKSEPERMVALENVRAQNDDQTLFADQLIVTMEAIPDVPGAAPAGAAEDLLGGSVNVKDFLATGDVQVLMSDGGRAFADRLEGDARQETAVLTGNNVTIARREMLIDQGTSLTISRLDGKATWDGPGQARLLRHPLDVSAKHRIKRPTVPTGPVGGPGGKAQQATGPGHGPVQMRARWNTRMIYDSRFNEGAGAIDLVGGVGVIADGDAMERSTMDGEMLSLQFAFAPDNTIQIGARTPGQGLGFAEGGDRVLEKLIARGDARLEHRKWFDETRTGLPRVFYIAARHITWNDLEVRAEVIGHGDLVIREPVPPGEAPPPEGPFAGPGTSRFVWTNRLDFKRQPSDRYEITMIGNVEGLYKGVASDDIATVTADRIEAITQRSRIDGGSSERTSPLDFQGDMTIEHLRAIGQVYLATPRRRADAHLVDYDTRTQIAMLESRPGRKVSIITEGSPLPVKATGMVWNMDPRVDSIQLINPSGVGNR